MDCTQRDWLNCACTDGPRKDKLTWSQASTWKLGLFRFKDPESVLAFLPLHHLHLPVPYSLSFTRFLCHLLRTTVPLHPHRSIPGVIDDHWTHTDGHQAQRLLLLCASLAAVTQFFLCMLASEFSRAYPNPDKLREMKNKVQCL